MEYTLLVIWKQKNRKTDLRANRLTTKYDEHYQQYIMPGKLHLWVVIIQWFHQISKKMRPLKMDTNCSIFEFIPISQLEHSQQINEEFYCE